MDEVQQIHDAAVANDVICAVGFQRRHAAVTREAMRQVAKLGPVSTAVGTFHKRMLGENAFSFTTTNWDDLCHAVDLVRYMAGGEPVEVTAYQDQFRQRLPQLLYGAGALRQRGDGVHSREPGFGRPGAARGVARDGCGLLFQDPA